MMRLLKNGSGVCQEDISSAIPLGRSANAVLFLAVDRPSFVTDAQMVVDGGVLA